MCVLTCDVSVVFIRCAQCGFQRPSDLRWRHFSVYCSCVQLAEQRSRMYQYQQLLPLLLPLPLPLLRMFHHMKISMTSPQQRERRCPLPHPQQHIIQTAPHLLHLTPNTISGKAPLDNAVLECSPLFHTSSHHIIFHRIASHHTIL